MEVVSLLSLQVPVQSFLGNNHTHIHTHPHLEQSEAQLILATEEARVPVNKTTAGCKQILCLKGHLSFVTRQP